MAPMAEPAVGPAGAAGGDAADLMTDTDEDEM
jgi:hypothetical protein